MNTSILPPNGLPQWLANIPLGQVFILTNPELGITSKTTHMMGFILSMAKQYKQNHNINTGSVDWPGLWDCFACKVKTDKGAQILISDKDTLIEMLCEFWGLDYDEVCKSIVIPKRNKSITYGGESHPIRIPIKPVKADGRMEKEDYGITMQLLQSHTKADELIDIRKSFQNIFYHHLDISIDDITALYEEVKESTKTYHLYIHIERENPTVNGRTPKITNCDIFLIDNLGEKHQLKMKEKKGEKPLEPQMLALYFTFILFKEGKRILDISDDDFFGLFMKILTQLPYGGYKKTTPDQLIENVQPKLSKIRKSIWEATHDTYAQEQFSIDGYEGEKYRVAGATDKDRKKIKKEFGLE